MYVDWDVSIASKRLAAFFVRALPSRSTAAVERSKDKEYHLSARVVPQGNKISLAGKYIVLLSNLVVSVAGQDLLILKLKLNTYLPLDYSKNLVLVFDFEIDKGSWSFYRFSHCVCFDVGEVLRLSVVRDKQTDKNNSAVD